MASGHLLLSCAKRAATTKIDLFAYLWQLLFVQSYLNDIDLKSYTDTAYHNEELKSLTRYRFDKVLERAKLKQSVSRLVTILFPELEKLVPTLHMASVYALLSEFPGAKQVAEAHLTHLKAVLYGASKGRYGRDMATTPDVLSTLSCRPSLWNCSIRSA